MARLATSHIARKKHEKKKRGAAAAIKRTKRQRRASACSPTTPACVRARGDTSWTCCTRARPWTCARCSRPSTVSGRETSRARANRRDAGCENRRERGGRVPNARRPGGARACDRARGRRLRGVRRAGRGRAVLHVPLQPVRPARRGRAAQPRKRSEKAKAKAKARPGDDETRRGTRKEHERERKSHRRVRVVVLDRPNPLGGLVTEGPTAIEPGFGSFVSRVAVPIRHGMTLGELALLFNSTSFVGADPDNPSQRALATDDLRVVRLKRWRREMAWEDTRLPWVPPSPNVPSPTSALAYAGTCLLEATNVCEGRGTTTPFELVGAPGADYRLANEMNRREPIREPNGSLGSLGARVAATRDDATRRKKKALKKGSSSVRDANGRWTRSMETRTKQPAPPCVWREAHFTPSWGKEKDVPCVGAAALFSRRDDDDARAVSPRALCSSKASRFSWR